MEENRRNRRKKRRDRRRAKRKVGTSRHVHRILRSIASPILTIPFRARAVNREVLSRVPKPYIILGNHSSVLDPFFVAVVARQPIQYVVSDSQFRNRFLSFVLGLVGSIPKTKVISDLETVKHIVKIKNNKGVIGIFPEGQSSWDGHSLPIVKSTFKLVKSLKIPVITAKLSGAYFTWPRWSPRPRRGRVAITFEQILDTPTIKSMSVEEIEALITEKLSHDASTFQRTKRQRYVGARQAEYLERVFFTCPSCGSRHTLRSHRRRFTCSSCDYSVYFTPFGFFEARRGALMFDNIRDWSVWQNDEQRKFLAGRVEHPGTEPIMVEERVNLQTGYKTLALKPLGTGTVRLYADRLVLAPPDAEELVFPVDDIEGINVQNNEKLEFYVYDDLYRLVTEDPRGNTYKWFLSVELLKEIRREANVAEESG